MSEQLRTRSRNSPTLRIPASGAEFAYREFGTQAGIPLVVLTHLGANLDSWDPRIVDGLAEDRHLIAVGYRGVGNSSGQIRESIEDMAEDMVAVIRALGYDRRMVPLANAIALTRQLPTAALTLLPDSGHGVAFQNHRAFVGAALIFSAGNGKPNQLHTH